MIPAIPTVYKGIRFRSRLEARWAYIFDRFGWKWEYEPFDLQGYIPDFMVGFLSPTLFEIKPGTTIEELEAAGEKALNSGFDGPITILGATKALSEADFTPIVGVQWVPEIEAYDGVCLFRCNVCGKASLNHDSQSFACQVSGCYDGSNHVSHYKEWDALWAEAQNHFQWKKEEG